MKNFVVADVETSGLDPHYSSILSIGAVKVVTGETFYGECCVFPGALINQSALDVNGFKYKDITGDPQLTGKMSEGELIRAFFKWLGGQHMLVGMNPHFDFSFLSHAAIRAGVDRFLFSHRTIDIHTLAILRAIEEGISIPEKGFYTDAIYELLGMEAEPKPHNALTGAKMELEAYTKLLAAVEMPQ